MAAEFKVNLGGLEEVIHSLPFINKRKILENVGVLVVGQTQHRIEQEKASPDGEKWQEWSETYAKTRHSGQSLLQSEGDLVQSIAYQVHGNELEVGSDEVYAGTQNYGLPEKNIPARQFLGLSLGNEKEIQQEIKEIIEGL